MSYVTNINPIDVNKKSGGTTKYFNNFTALDVNVTSNIDDAIIGYFEQIADSKEAARALAGAVISTAINQGVDPMDTLAEFAKLPQGQLNSYTTMFLNLSRKGTSYLGISNSPDAPKYVTHMIRP